MPKDSDHKKGNHKKHKGRMAHVVARKHKKPALVGPAPRKGYDTGSKGETLITPIQGYAGCVVLLQTDPPPAPYKDYYSPLAYISFAAGPTTVDLGTEGATLLFDLPDGLATTFEQLEKAIVMNFEPDPPPGVGNGHT